MEITVESGKFGKIKSPAREVGIEGLMATRPIRIADNAEGYKSLKSWWVLTHVASGHVVTPGHWEHRTIALAAEAARKLTDALPGVNWLLETDGEILRDVEDKGQLYQVTRDRMRDVVKWMADTDGHRR